MYLIVTHIPIFVSGSRTFVDDGWYADLILAREFFAPHFGEIHVAGPSLSVSQAGTLSLHEIAPETDAMQLHPLGGCPSPDADVLVTNAQTMACRP